MVVRDKVWSVPSVSAPKTPEMHVLSVAVWYKWWYLSDSRWRTKEMKLYFVMEQCAEMWPSMWWQIDFCLLWATHLCRSGQWLTADEYESPLATQMYGQVTNNLGHRQASAMGCSPALLVRYPLKKLHLIYSNLFFGFVLWYWGFFQHMVLGGVG